MNNDLLKQAANCLAIQDVYMQSTDVKLADDFNPKYPNSETLDWQQRQGALDWKVSELKVKSKEKEVVNLLLARFQCALRFLPPNLSEEIKNDPEKSHAATLAEVKAVYIAEYRITCDKLSDEAISVFTGINVGYHVWPYWREYMHSVSDRIRTPRIILPLYMIPKEE